MSTTASLRPEGQIPELRYRTVLTLAWPIILANAAVPLLGLVDTTVIGHFGSAAELAALALASLLFNFIYWSMGFLRMATTAFVAQADGAGDGRRLMLLMCQSALIALLIASALLICQTIILRGSLLALSPPNDVVPVLVGYFEFRIFAAPATLLTYVLVGYFIGRGMSRHILVLQVCLNVSNAALDILFAGVFAWGIHGIAWGTVMAEYLTLMLALSLVYRMHPWLNFIVCLKVHMLIENIKSLLNQNNDIFIRTLFLLLGFMFFARIGGGFGETQLAANHILLLLISFSAFFLDGYAHVLESLTGKAFGRKSLHQLDRAFKKTSVLAAVAAITLACFVYVFGSPIISSLTNKPDIIAAAQSFLPYAALYILLSVAAFQLDGLFIGAAYGAAMRNCSIISTVVFCSVWYLGFDKLGNSGLWISFIIYVCVRALTLSVFVSTLRRRCAE